MPRPQIHKATFFCEEMGLRNLFQGLLPYCCVLTAVFKKA